MNKEWLKRLSGLGILAVVATLTLVFDSLGTAQQPATYRVAFERGVSLDTATEAALSAAIEDALVRDDARIVVAGHTGTRGDADANLALSRQRAEAIAQRLRDAGIDPDRIESLGLGGREPLTRTPDESDRAFQRRLSRAVITVVPQ